MQFTQFLLVFLGSGLGSCSRYFVSQVVRHELELEHAFPVGTFTVNIIGCFVVGIFIGLIERFQRKL